VGRAAAAGAPRAAQRAPDRRQPPTAAAVRARAGAAGYAEVWLPAAAERGFPAHAVSLRGHGASGGAELRARTLLRDYVHDVLQAAVTLPVRPVLVGHGLGALVVARALTRYPARAAVLLAPAPRSDAREPVLVRWQAAATRTPAPPVGAPPVLVIGERSGPPAGARRAARAYGGTPVWVDRLDPADPAALRLVLDWVTRVAPPVAAAS
jgi:pimeloyl-ACP methyl ester carboxylesterase